MKGQTTVQAWYEEARVKEYAGNPLIEAMPPILSEEEAVDRIATSPPLPGDERYLPKEIRLHCINRLMHLVQPLSIHLELEAVISSVLRSGYVGRNPMEAGTWRHLHALAARNSTVPMFNSTASTFSLIGLSGMGKTTALLSILRMYPQVIKHTRYQGRDFIHTQIVWLHLQCPSDGSLSGLCHAFFRAIDAALGEESHTSYYKSRRSIADLVQGMEQKASTFFIGGIFIDELQNLHTAKTGGKQNMLNFFVNLINSIGIPVVFVGTNSMIGLFSDIVRNARRASGQGVYDFKQPSESDAEWNMLIEAMWDYQWVENPSPLTDRLRGTLYYLTQGVTDFLTKLMILGQRYAIQSGIEQLNEKVFEHVSETKMKLLQPALDALRSKDPNRMRKFDDLLPPDVQLEEMMRGTIFVLPDRIKLLKGRKPESTLSTDAAESTRAGDPRLADSTGPQGQQTKSSCESLHAHVPTGDNSQRIGPQPLSSKYDGKSDVFALLREEGLILDDPFEFVPVYRAA